jgi:pyruvate kinase
LAAGSVLRRTKILCTLGPASSSRKIIRSMMDAGMDAVRLNFSHGDHASHDALIENVRKVAAERGRSIPIIQDLQGPRFRLGKLKDGYIDLKRGDEITLGGRQGDGREIPIRPSYPFESVKAGDRITVGDLGVSFRVTSTTAGKIRCRVTKGGTIHSGKGVSFPDSKSELPALTAKDIRDLRFGISRKVTYSALSFVRSAQDVVNLRRRIGKHDIGIISKIETKEAVQDIEAIIDHSDAILVARGDLATEVSISRVPLVQKLLIEKCRLKAKPVITATQMLESMITNPQPTRAEASDVANAVLDGTDVVMLSGETTIGAYPVEAVKTMASIILRTEAASLRDEIGRRRPLLPVAEVGETIAYLAAQAAHSLKAKAIITFTMSGSTALRVSKFRPEVPIFAVTPSKTTRLKLALSHGTICGEIGKSSTTDQMLEAAITVAKKCGIVKKGDMVVVTAGVPPLTKGKTNLLKVEVV